MDWQELIGNVLFWGVNGGIVTASAFSIWARF